MCSHRNSQENPEAALLSRSGLSEAHAENAVDDLIMSPWPMEPATSDSFPDAPRTVSARLISLSQTFTKEYAHRFSRSINDLSLQNDDKSHSLVNADNHVVSMDVSTPESVESAHQSACRDRRRFVRTASAAQKALTGLRFVAKTASSGDTGCTNAVWKEVEARFYKLASTDARLAVSDFAHCIGMDDSEEFAKELFEALARKRGQEVHPLTLDELHKYWMDLTDQTFDNRLQIFFNMVDRNADGHITKDEVNELIKLSASANNLHKLKEQSQEYASLIMEELDSDGVGYIEISQLESLFLQGTLGYAQGACLNSQDLNYSQTLSQNLAQRKRGIIRKWIQHNCNYISENWRRAWVMCLWLATMAILFTWKFFQYKERAAFQVMGYCVCVAKGAAETLKLNMAVILLPVCRNTVTWLRSSTKLGSIIPLDDNLNFHKVIAVAITMGVILHGGLHLTCDFPRIITAPEDKYKLIAHDFGGERPTYGFFLMSVEGITGVIMVVLMAVNFTLATRWFRRSLVKLPKPLQHLAGFNAFWFSHHLFIVVYICLVIHGIFLFLSHEWYQKSTWMYLAVPMLIYSGERLLRFFRTGRKGVEILKVAVYPGNVLKLHMRKPRGFKYKSGQYVYLNCPQISTFQWHPFSITSAPADDYVSVHIRTLGDWTQDLKCIFSEVCEPSMGGKSGLLRRDCMSGGLASGESEKVPLVFMDGPYGSAAQDYKSYDVMVLVGLGIGATPFISILKDMLHSFKLAEQQQWPQEPLQKSNGSKKRQFNRAYFYWVTREESSLDWFKGILNDVMESDHKGIVELHNYLTGAYEEGDARSALITMLQTLNQAKHGVDILSGTRVRTHLGRPDWRSVFSTVAASHKGHRVGVYYCGTSTLAKELKALTSEFNEKFYSTYKTWFDFYKAF
ncbi:hypothetical protein KP509_25G036700 [Ceratopteris richardii]|uniref:Uncharacterized protein n=1 Tax=Ceratopteris richardii TaxID=49495 RepID=A0A8T2RPA0_CERRI|nr:hypothetical protein KP509_25G036700 [Ceratopteris richardii]